MSFFKKRIGDVEGGFGETLRELRELRGHSLEELGRRTGIHPLLILAFEEERLEDLSDPLYAERHVTILAEALESRASYLLEKYRELLEEHHVAPTRTLFPGPKVRKSELFVRSRAIAFAVFLCIAAVIGGYVFWQAAIISSVPRLAVESPAEGAVYDQPRVHVAGVTDPGAFVRVNGFTAVVDPQGVFSLSLDVPRGVSTVHVESHRRYGASAVVDRHITYSVPSGK